MSPENCPDEPFPLGYWFDLEYVEPPKSDEELMEEAWQSEIDQMEEGPSGYVTDYDSFVQGWQAAHKQLKGESK